MKERNSNPDSEYNISASYGFAETNSENIIYSYELIQMADRKMYENKRRAKIKGLDTKPIKF